MCKVRHLTYPVLSSFFYLPSSSFHSIKNAKNETKRLTLWSHGIFYQLFKRTALTQWAPSIRWLGWVLSCVLNLFMAVRIKLKTRLNRFNASESIQRPGSQNSNESSSRRRATRRLIFFVRTGPVMTGTDSMPFDISRDFRRSAERESLDELLHFWTFSNRWLRTGITLKPHGISSKNVQEINFGLCGTLQGSF